jgi:hypothetical protein
METEFFPEIRPNEGGHFNGHVKGGWLLPCTLLTTESIHLESSIFTRFMLSWTRLADKSKCIEFSGLSSLRELGLTCLSDSRYLKLG